FSCSRRFHGGPASRVRRAGFRPRLEPLEGRRLMSAGALDTTFNPAGPVPGGVLGPLQDSDGGALPFGSSSYGPVVIYPNSDTHGNAGKIVATGYTIDSQGYQDFALVRYNTDGSLDSTFNGGNPSNVSGVVSTHVGVSDADVFGLALQSDGKIV